jgi:hypothetical protein
VARVAAFFAAVHAVWASWPGVLFRWIGATLIISTIVANALVVPFLNARAMPIAQAQLAMLTQRAVTLDGIRWISPPGLAGAPRSHVYTRVPHMHTIALRSPCRARPAGVRRPGGGGAGSGGEI